MCCLCNLAVARQWSDKSGKYSIEGDLIATNDDWVVIKQTNGRLSAVKLSDLSEADPGIRGLSRRLNHIKESDGLQTWTLGDGYKVKGRVVAYGHKDVVVSRRRSRIYVNDRPFQNLPEVYQLIVRKMIGQQEAARFRELSRR